MYLNIGQGAAAPNTNIGGFASNVYWSSNENSYNIAGELYFSNGQIMTDSKPGIHYVRAIRSF